MFNSCKRPSILCKTLTAAGPQLLFAAVNEVFEQPSQAAPSGPWREDNNNRAELYATVEVNHVLVGHANAARRDGSADIFWLIGAVDAVLRVLAARVQI